MPGYLDRYGEGYEQRAKRNKIAAVVIFVALAGGVGLYLGLRNHRQKAQVRQFIELLQKQDYDAAYRMWGCTETKPCPDYTFSKFKEDWGPQSKNAKISSFQITKSKACGSGVIIDVDVGENRGEQFWVENKDLTIGFSPWSTCPAR